jgi:hypothetical protein
MEVRLDCLHNYRLRQDGEVCHILRLHVRTAMISCRSWSSRLDGPRARCRCVRVGRRTSLSRRCGHGTSDTPDGREGRLSLRANHVAAVKGKPHRFHIRQLTYDKRHDIIC